MGITKEYLEAKIKECKEALEQLRNNANAYIGAIQMLERILAELDTPAP